MRVDFTLFREKQVTEIGADGRVLREEGRRSDRERLVERGGVLPRDEAGIGAGIRRALVGSGGSGGGATRNVRVSFGKVTVERPTYKTAREAARLAREAAGGRR